MPEPITRVFDTNSPEEITEYVQRLVRSTIKTDAAIDRGRKGMFGNGLMKSLSLHEKDAQGRIEKVFDFLRALSNNSEPQIMRLSEGYAAEAKSLLDTGRLTPYEYKSLAPAVEGTNSAGGYTVPIEFAADLSRNLGIYGYARRYLRTVQMARKVWELAGVSAKPSVAVTAENSAIAATKPTLDQLVLTAKKVAGIYAASNELLEDANIDTYSIILDLFTEQFQIAEDTYAFNNDNTNYPGILWYGAGTITSGIAANGARAVSRTGSSTGGATGYPKMSDTASATDSWADLLLMMQNQPSALFAGGKFFIDQNVVTAMLNTRDSQNRMLHDLAGSFQVHTGLQDQPSLWFMGYEVVVLPSGIMFTYDTSAHVSSPYTAFMNPQRCYAMMGIRGGFVVDNLREATLDSVSLGANDLSALRMKERIAFGVGRPETMIVLRTDAS